MSAMSNDAVAPAAVAAAAGGVQRVQIVTCLQPQPDFRFSNDLLSERKTNLCLLSFGNLCCCTELSTVFGSIQSAIDVVAVAADVIL